MTGKKLPKPWHRCHGLGLWGSGAGPWNGGNLRGPTPVALGSAVPMPQQVEDHLLQGTHREGLLEVRIPAHVVPVGPQHRAVLACDHHGEGARCFGLELLHEPAAVDAGHRPVDDRDRGRAVFVEKLHAFPPAARDLHLMPTQAQELGQDCAHISVVIDEVNKAKEAGIRPGGLASGQGD